MTFAHPQLFWLLALPAALLLGSFLLRARAAERPHPKIPRATVRPGRRTFVLGGDRSSQRRPVVASLALACLITALARPQGATISTPSLIQARDVLVAVDVSRSMLADDVAPTRLGRAQLLVRNLADELRGERLGLLPFAGTAFLQSPLSADYEIFRTFLDELGPDMIPAGGSNFAALLRTADEAFGPPDSTEPDAPARPDRFLVILSDGEAEDDSWRPFAQKLAGRGVRVLALGLGTADGAMVPDGKGGLTKDERGAVVLSRLNPATLQELARVTDGAYRDASSWVDLPGLLKETITRGRAARVATDTAPRRQELFAWFLAPALVLLAAALVREFPATPRVSKNSLRVVPAASARVLPLLLVLHCACVLSPRSSAAETPPAAPADPLVELVGRLAAAPELSASDFARLATLTAERGEQAMQPGAAPGASVPEGAIRDALAAVSAGQAADPRAADWPALRKRLEALLAPPPDQPPPQQQPQENRTKPDDAQQSDAEKPPQEQSSSENTENSENTSGSEDSRSGGTSPDSPQQDAGSSGESTRPSGSQPLGDLAKPDEKQPGSDSTEAAPAEQPASDDEPTQQAGGVSASGRPADAEAGAELDPGLVVPQQRLERVRDSDAPARLFQLIQESENPSEARERRAAGTKQTW